MRGSDGYQQANYWTAGLAINNTAGIEIDNLTVTGASSQQGTGIAIAGLNSSSFSTQVNVAKSSFMGLATGISYGQFVQGITVDQTNFTFVTTGIGAATGLSGPLVQLAVTNSQFNPGAVTGGAGINSGSPIVGLSASNNFFITGGSAQFGIVVQQAEHCMIANNEFQGINSTGSFGVVIGTRNSGGTCVVSHNDLFGYTSSGTGIWLQSGSASVTVDGNTFTNNAINITSAGTDNFIFNNFGNPGYNPVGMSAPSTMGASPFVVTAGPTPETHYIIQGSSGAINCSRSGQAVGTGTAPTPYIVIELGPGDSYSCTWSTTAPTFARDIH
jgi:hypothetical protein